MNASAKSILERVASWPEEDQQELAEIAVEIEAARKRELYHLSDEERAAVREGLEAARKGEFASDDEINNLYRLHRKA
jgi:predicted transcriptional regulator